MPAYKYVEIAPGVNEFIILYPERYEGLGECWHSIRARLNSGYAAVRRDKKTVLLHRYVYAAANSLSLADIENKVVMHKCDMRTCINPDHLALGTQAENLSDRINKGRANMPSGTGHYAVTLTLADIDKIVELYATAQITQELLAKQFNVSAQTISYVVRGIHALQRK